MSGTGNRRAVPTMLRTYRWSRGKRVGRSLLTRTLALLLCVLLVAPLHSVASAPVAVAAGGDTRIVPASDHGWVWQNPLPQGNLLRDIDFADADNAWAVGWAGTIMRTTDGGQTWEWQDSGTRVRLDGVHFHDAQTGWVVGEGGAILKTTDAGDTWTSKPSGTTNLLEAVYFVDADTGWVSGSNGTIRKTTDGGETWDYQWAGGTTQGLSGLHFADEDNGWAVAWAGTIIRTTDGGDTWITAESGTTRNLLSVHFADKDTGWVTGSAGTILKSTDGGVSWEEQESHTSVGLWAVHSADEDTVWVSGNEGTVLKTTDGGATWSAQNPSATQLLSIRFADKNVGAVVGAGGEIIVTTDGGGTWTRYTSGSLNQINGIDFIDEVTGLAVAGSGGILKTVDAGETWTVQDPGTDEYLTDIHFPDAYTGYIVGWRDTILKTIDGGDTWTPQETPDEEWLAAVHFVDAETGWAVGRDGAILSTENGGGAWTAQQSGHPGWLRDVHFADANIGWAVGDDGTILSTVDGGDTWDSQDSGTNEGLSTVHFVDSETGWAAGWRGTLLKTDDGGSTWVAQDPQTADEINCVYALDHDVAWTVGWSGQIRKTIDGGLNWLIEDSGTSSWLIAVRFIDANTGWAVGQSGTIIHQSPHTITASAGPDGSISPEGAVSVGHGQSQTFTVTPDAGYRVDTVLVDGEPETLTGDTYAFENVTRDHTIDVTFTVKTYTLAYTAGPGGTVVGDLSQTVAHGGDGTEVTAIPDEGYTFVKWSDGRTDNPRTDTYVTEEITAQAEFVRDALPPIIKGNDRFATAIAGSKAAYPDGADAVVIATGEHFADALGGAGLAGALDAPLLLTQKGALPSAVAAEISRLGASKVYILGGVGAVSADVGRAIDRLPKVTSVTRIAGSNRYQTATAVANETIKVLNANGGYNGDAFIATGANFPDALGASPVAAAKGMPVFLADPARDAVTLPASVKRVWITGGTAVVSAKAEASLKTSLGAGNVKRLAGANRFETAARVAAFGVSRGMQWEGVGITTGMDFPDALAAGPALGSRGAVMLLTDTNAVPHHTRNALITNKAQITRVTFFGGDAAVPPAVRTAVNGHIK